MASIIEKRKDAHPGGRWKNTRTQRCAAAAWNEWRAGAGINNKTGAVMHTSLLLIAMIAAATITGLCFVLGIAVLIQDIRDSIHRRTK